MMTYRLPIVWSVVVLLCGVLTGCTSAPLPPTTSVPTQPSYSQGEDPAVSDPLGGWWHPDNTGLLRVPPVSGRTFPKLSPVQP
jgi:hypothetical protein